MAIYRDYVPRRDADFNKLFINIIDYAHSKVVDDKVWTHIPDTELQDFERAYDDWFIFYQPPLQPHFPSATTMKNDARKRNEKIARDFVQRFLYWPPVTDGDRVNMDLPLRDPIRTPQLIVTEEVEFDLKLSRIRAIEVHFRVKGAENKAKPDGYDGAVMIWDILAAPPTRPADLTRHTMASRTPNILEFDETERGKTVYISAAWQNERGTTGPWAEVVSAVVP